VLSMTDMSSQAGGARHHNDDDRKRFAIEAKTLSLKVALIVLVVWVVGLAVVGVVVDLTWR
jgi:hypothetical protein